MLSQVFLDDIPLSLTKAQEEIVQKIIESDGVEAALFFVSYLNFKAKMVQEMILKYNTLKEEVVVEEVVEKELHNTETIHQSPKPMPQDIRDMLIQRFYPISGPACSYIIFGKKEAKEKEDYIRNRAGTLNVDGNTRRKEDNKIWTSYEIDLLLILMDMGCPRKIIAKWLKRTHSAIYNAADRGKKSRARVRVAEEI